MRALLLTVLTSFILNVSAQQPYKPGYIIDHSGDTTEGLIAQLADSTAHFKCRFKKEISAFRTFYEYNPQDIIAYGTYGKTHFESTNQSEIHEDQPIFMEILVKGPLSLLRFRDQYYVEANNTRYLLSDKQSKEKDYQDILLDLMDTCPTLAVRIDNTLLNRRSLIQLFDDYYTCTGKDYTVYEKHFEWPEVTNILTAGMYFSTITFESQSKEYDYLSGKWETATGPLIGIQWNLKFNEFSHQFSIRTGVYSQFIRFKGAYQETSPTYQQNDIKFEFTQIKIPFGIQHRFSQSTLSPVFNMGLTGSLNLGVKTERKITKQNSDIVNEESIILRPFQVALHIGLGAVYELDQKHDLLLEFRYEKPNSIEKRQDVGFDLLSNMNTYSFLAGFTF